MANGGGANRRSLVVDHGVYSNACGYCKSSRRSSVSHGLTAFSLTVSDYQDLLDRGWRRSGTFLYNPDGERTCCPAYTIRLEADAFVPSKAQVRVKRRMQRYLDGYDRQELQENKELKQENKKAKTENRPVDEAAAAIAAALKTVANEWLRDRLQGSAFELPEVAVRPVPEKIRKPLRETGGEYQYTSNIAFLVASTLKRHNSGNDMQAADGVSVAEGLAAKLESGGSLGGVTVRACKGHLNFSMPDFQASIAAGSVSQDRAEVHSETKTVPRGRKRSFEFRMRSSSFDPEEFELYKRYQIAVHQENPDEVKESTYKRFLVDTPLIPTQIGSITYGSFHQQYRIDGRLVAVGVVDILPKCLSSKYLIWDPDFAFLSLGKFSVLKELEWVQTAHRLSALLQYYYLGYYIHSCPKMRYKASYYPSELLCPVKLDWVPFHVARPLLRNSGFICLSSATTTTATATTNGMEVLVEEGDTSTDNTQEDMNDRMESQEIPRNGEHVANEQRQPQQQLDEEAAQALGEVPLMFNNRCWKFKHLEAAGVVRPQMLRALKSKLFKYWTLVGSQLASRVIYVLAPDMLDELL